MAKIVSGKGISKRQAKEAKSRIGKRRGMMLQERRWARRSGEVRVGRVEDLPEDHPARQADA